MTAALMIASGWTNGGHAFSPEKQIGTISAIKRIALLLQQAAIRNIVVVCEEEAKKLVPCMNLIFLKHPRHGDMLKGIQTGLMYLHDKCDEVLVAPVDVPLFAADTVNALLATPGSIVIPSYRYHGGHPILLRRDVFSAICSYEGSDGLRGAINGLPHTYVTVEDAGVLSSVKGNRLDPQLTSVHHMTKLTPSFRFRIQREQVFYGPGIHQLLHLTMELGSLSEACRHMGISYGKGRSMVRTMEEQLACPVLETKQGGRDGGSSVLTSEAKAMVDAYDAFSKEAEDTLNKLFERYFPQEIQ